MGYTIGMPSLKLSNIEGKGGKHCGNFAKVAKEALEERLGQDLDINHELTQGNYYEGFRTAAELQAYSDKWIADRNAEIEENNNFISGLVELANKRRAEEGKPKLKEKEVLRIINAERKKKDEPPLEKKKKIRRDAVVMCATLIKPPQEFMAKLSREEQERFLLDGLDKFKEIVGANNVKAAVIHWDELVPHIHVFWQPITANGRLCAKEKHNLRFFGQLNREMPKYFRAKGWKEIDDCDAYDVEEAQEIRETKGEEAYREYKENRRKEKTAKGKKSGRDSKTFKSDADKAVAEAQKEREAEERAAEQARRQRETDEQASAEAQEKQQQAEATLHELQTAISDEVFEKANAFRVIGEKLSGGAKKLTSEEINTVQNMAAVIGQVMAECKRATAEQDQSKKAYESAQKRLKDTLATEQDRIQYEAKNLSLNEIMRSKRELAEARKKAENDIVKATSEADKARKERDEARRVCEWATSEPFAETDRRYRQNRLKEQGRSLCD